MPSYTITFHSMYFSLKDSDLDVGEIVSEVLSNTAQH